MRHISPQDSNLLSLIARLCAGTRPAEGTYRYKDIADLKGQIKDKFALAVADNIMAGNEQDKTAVCYMTWARSIRQGSGNSMQQRLELVERTPG